MGVPRKCSQSYSSYRGLHAREGGREGGRREREIPEHEHQRFKSVYLGKEM
jgi:hypothetical protein